MNPGLSGFCGWHYAARVKLAELETVLLSQDITKRVQLHCLACRRRLAAVVMGDGLAEDGGPELSLSISHLSEDLRDFQQKRSSIGLVCGCGTRSKYHMLWMA